MTEGISFTKLVKAARGMNGECAECNGDGCPYLIDGWCDQDKIGADAAEALEALLQTCAEWTARYEAERDKNKDAVPVVRCEECRWALLAPQRQTATCMKRRLPYTHDYDWFCADGERKDGADDA